MFSKVALFVAASMAVFVAAAPSGINNSCNTGAVQCCNSLVDSKSAEANVLFSLLGVALDTVSGTVGVNCAPITIIGTGSGADCSAQPVCCDNNSFNGLVAVGCTPINVNA
ncbi:type 1 hydrophobin [Gymnopilus junonius]|uniref:Hydrophobin n=1 Tax=Gymnopilus junonius TaxID=109634 RepID=A0A9P5NUH4_GYMJU|nr:type 1 hydrophobin [Gymnopilus junonius]